MPQLDIDFDVWKALTARRKDETHSYNDVMREILSLGAPSAPLSTIAVQGRALGKHFLPNGTKLRSRHKGQWYYAKIADGQFVDGNGIAYNSASSAARAITGTSVNGLTFWSAKKPDESEWTQLAFLKVKA